MRELLSACGLMPFVKTTGGKGIQVVVAIKGTAKNPATWLDAKAFALSVADRMARTTPTPDRYTANMSKEQRGGENSPITCATIVWRRPWRRGRLAREGATIATPLSWKEIRKGLNPADFTIASAKSLLKRADPWKDLAASAASLDAAMKKLTKL